MAVTSDIAAVLKQAGEQVESARKTGGQHEMLAEALLHLSEVHLAQRSPELALKAANEALEISQDSSTRSTKAAANLCICNSHLGKIALQSDKFPARVDTMGALRAAKASYKEYVELVDNQGKERASKALSRALLATGVPASMVPRSEAFAQTADVAGTVRDLGGHTSPFHAPAIDIRPSTVGSHSPGHHFDRTSFNWRDVTSQLCHTMVWEPYKNWGNHQKMERRNALAKCKGARSSAYPLYHSLKPVDLSLVKSDAPLCVHINTYDASTNYAETLMATMYTISSMIKENLRRLTIVQVGEAPPEGKGAPNANAARQVALSPAILAMVRTLRIEAPQVSVGFVSGDAASWMSNREALVAAIFDTHGEEETELIWSRSQPMMPSLIQKPLPEPIAVKIKAPHDA